MSWGTRWCPLGRDSWNCFNCDKSKFRLEGKVYVLYCPLVEKAMKNTEKEVNQWDTP